MMKFLMFVRLLKSQFASFLFQNLQHGLKTKGLTDEILNTFAAQQSFIWKIVQEFDSFPQTFDPPPHIPTQAQVLQVKSALSKLVLGFPDKNSGIPDIYCPTILWNDMYNSFYKNINFERKDHLSEKCILQHFKHAYESNKWVV